MEYTLIYYHSNEHNITINIIFSKSRLDISLRGLDEKKSGLDFLTNKNIS